jgi:hypothetical protein
MRDVRITVLVADSEKTAFALLAEREGLSASSLLRRLGRQEAERRGLLPIAQGQPPIPRAREAVPA